MQQWRGKYLLDSGDDTFITRWLYSKGWAVKIQIDPNAEISTVVADSPKYLQQLMRWARNSRRSYLRCIFYIPGIWRSALHLNLNNSFAQVLTDLQEISLHDIYYARHPAPTTDSVSWSFALDQSPSWPNASLYRVRNPHQNLYYLAHVESILQNRYHGHLHLCSTSEMAIYGLAHITAGAILFVCINW